MHRRQKLKRTIYNLYFRKGQRYYHLGTFDNKQRCLEVITSTQVNYGKDEYPDKHFEIEENDIVEEP